MPTWTDTYYDTLVSRFDDITEDLDTRLDDIIEGRVAPALEDVAIGSARKLRAAVLFFDIRGFSKRTAPADNSARKTALHLLDAVIPMIMHLVYDFGGYIEKNTGDGIAAILGADATDGQAANSALDVATISFYLLKRLINPYLESHGLGQVEARIGLDLGTLLFARIGTPTGTSKFSRNFLTVVGPSANLASRLQEMAGTNQIWAGDLIKRNAGEDRQHFFQDMTPNPWTWTYVGDGSAYRIWHYDAYRKDPSS